MISLRKACSSLAFASLFLGACSDDPTGAPTKAATLRVVGKTTITATPNLPAADPVQVKLDDARGGALPSRLVVFSVTGAAKLSADSVYTDQGGIASVVVTAGPAGTYTVTASSEGVAPVTVTVNATSASPQLLLLQGGSGQGGLASEALLPFTAIALNSDGTPAAGVTVNFAVTAGGGSLSNATAVTDASGKASTTLTLGPSGPQTVTATAPALPSATRTVTFNATLADPCTAARGIAVPDTKNRSLDVIDCHNPQNRYIEFHRFTTTGALSAVLVTETSAAFAPALTLSRAGGTDTLAKDSLLAPGSDSYRIFAPAGTWWLGASSTVPNSTGAFTLTTAVAPTTNDNCPTVPIFVVPGTPTAKTSISGNIAATDCVFSGDATQKADQYFVYLRQGQQLRIDLQAVPLSNSSIDLWIRVRNMTTGAFNNTDCCGGATVEARTHTAATTGLYRIEAGVYYDPTAPTPQTGPYVMDFWVP